MLKISLFVTILSINLYCGDLAHTPPDHSWHVLVFVQHWPETVCKDYLSRNASRHCNYPNEPDAWSVHGIWPTKYGTKGPSKCDRTKEFQPNEIKTIRKDLNQAWIDVHGDSPPNVFWAAEWLKHGTCALSLSSLDSQLKYFSQAIKWMKDYSMKNVLKKENIVPSETKTYTVAEINKAIIKQLGVNPVISCNTDCTAQYLNELRICFDKDLKLANCKPYGFGDNVITDCNVTRSVVYPVITKKQKLDLGYFEAYWHSYEE